MSAFTEMLHPALWNHGRASSQAAAASAAPRTVVLGYDGSQAARRALRRAAEAAEGGGRVVVVTAVPLSPAHAYEVDWLIAEPEDIVEEAAALLRENDVEITTCVAGSEPAEALVAAAVGTDAALIVVGARGDNYLARALRGSVVEKLIARAPCDVLVAR